MSKIDHKPTQNTRILEYIKKHGYITSDEAEYYLGVKRLASRICDLKRRGYIFSDEWLEVKNRWGEDCRVKKYYLEGKPDD